jgi:hypothetical protein
MEHLTDARMREIVQGRISVSRQNIALMKGLLLKHFHSASERMIQTAVREVVGFDRPERVIVRYGEDSTHTLENLGDYFSWTLCAIEALWELLNTGILLPMSSHSLTTISTTVTIIQQHNGGGSSGGEDFNSFGGEASSEYLRLIQQRAC